MKPEFWRFFAIAFGVGLAFSVLVNVILHSALYDFRNVSHGRKLMFLWPPDAQRIVNGTLRMEVLLDWETVPENLTIIVKVNDDDGNSSTEWSTQGNDAVGLKLDTNRDNQIGGEGDADYIFFANQRYYPPDRAIVAEGGLSSPIVAPYPSSYHRCSFDPSSGYTFWISLPKNDIDFRPRMLILLVYEDSSLKAYRCPVYALFKVGSIT